MMTHLTILLRKQVAKLQIANEVHTKRKSLKKKSLQTDETLTSEVDSQLVAQKNVVAQEKEKRKRDESEINETFSTQRRCEKCDETEHNFRFCQKNDESVLESNIASESNINNDDVEK